MLQIDLLKQLFKFNHNFIQIRDYLLGNNIFVFIFPQPSKNLFIHKTGFVVAGLRS